MTMNVSGPPWVVSIPQSPVSGGAARQSLIATKCRPPGFWYTSFQNAMGYCSHIATEDFTQFSIVAVNWYLANGAGESLPGAAITEQWCIEDVAGVRYPITFSGASTVTLSDGATVQSDVITLQTKIKRGQRFRVGCYQSCPSGVLVTSGQYSDTNVGDVCDFGTTGAPATVRLATGSGSPGTNGFGWLLRPAAILGLTSKPTAVIFGTSIANGQGDLASDGYRLMGWVERIIGKRTAFCNMSAPGTMVLNFAGASTKRRGLLTLCSPTFILNEYSTNDFVAGGRTAAEVIADIAAMKVQCGGLPIVQTTCLPRTNASNVTVSAAQAQRPTFNAAVIALQAPFDGYIDGCPIVESTSTPGTWINGPAAGVPDTTDGVHPTSAACQRWQLSNLELQGVSIFTNP
jgi:hypothetical protein